MKNKKPNKAFKFIKSSGGIDEYRLRSNGLTILLMEDHSTPVVTFMITYHVGSRNEAIGHTGATHILEHMMFKGSQNYNREKGTRAAEVLQNLGAQINATTWMDRTNYFELLPSEHLEEGIKVEADRMRNALLQDDDHQAEMEVVRNEFERGENEPFTALDKNIWATAFQAHPYHHPTIGWLPDIENVPIEKLRQFYDTYYWPNNATATIIGDFQKEEAQVLIEKYFGQYPCAPHKIPAMYTTEPSQEGPRRLEINRVGQTGIVGVAHKVSHGRHEDVYALQIMSKILGGGKSSRLYRKLVESGLVTNLFMFDFPFHDDGLLIAYAFLTPGTDHITVEKIILEEYADIIANGVSNEEVKKAQAQLRSDIAISRDGSFSIASSLNEAIAIGDWTLYTNQLANYNLVTVSDVKRVAGKYLVNDQSTTGWFIPKKAEQAGTNLTNGVHQPQAWQARVLDESLMDPVIGAKPPGGRGMALAAQITEQQALKGLQIFTMNNGVNDVVTIVGSMLGGDVYSPRENPLLGDMVAVMLDQGTLLHDKLEINEALESVGASIGFSSGNYRMRFSARCLKDDIPLVIDLLAEQLQKPAFNADDLTIVKKRLIGEIERSKENTRIQAQIALLRKLYPDGHPNYRLTIDEEIAFIEQISSDDLKKFHNRTYGLGSVLLVAVGDVNKRTFVKAVKMAFKDWQCSQLEEFRHELKAVGKQSQADYILVPDKTSADMFIGQAIGIDRNHEDYYPLMVGLYILGGNFSARLMSTVRDQQGLTYGISAGLGGVDNGNDGYWFSWGTFAPDLLEKGRQATLEQLRLLVKSGITDQELANKKTTLTGLFKVGLATTAGLAEYILNNAERGREVAFLDQFPVIIEGLKQKQVNTAFSKYIDLEKLIYVAAGTISDQ